MSTDLDALPAEYGPDGLLALQSNLEKALDEARTLDGVLGVKAAAEVAQAYGRKVKAERESVASLLRTAVRAERRLAEEVNAAQGRGEIASKGDTSRAIAANPFHRKVAAYRECSDPPIHYDEMGFNRNHVAGWRKMLSADLETIERGINSAKDYPTKADILRAIRESDRAAKREAEAGEEGETCTVADLYDLVREGRTFGTIYADPPWRYDNQATRAATRNHYKPGEENPESGMTVEQICELPVREMAAKDAHLHLWTTNGFLFECPRIFEAWGFEFRSSFVWVKSTMGIGNYWRNSHEFLLTAIRGDAKRFNDHGLMSWMESKRGKHSSKPEQVRAMLEAASPGPRLELFGRAKAKGWSVWGNEVSPDALYQDYIKEVA